MAEQRCRWKSEYFGYECQDLPYSQGYFQDPDGYCILHSRKEDKDTNQFREAVKGRLKTEGESIDLKGCYFPAKFDRGYFVGYEFGKPVDFDEATFLREMDFSKAKFSQKTLFRVADFSQGAYFNEVTFSQYADFSWAIFSEVYFSGTTFDKGVNFDMAEFREWVFFGPIHTAERRNRRVAFGPGASFCNTRFLQNIRFQEVDLSRCSFLHSNINKVDFSYCEFAKEEKKSFLIFSPRKQNVLRDELDADKEVKNNPNGKNFREERYEPVRRLYLELKRNFENNKDWNTAGDFHYGEMECKRKAGLYWPFLHLYWAFSGYGERYLRAFFWLLLYIFLLFPFLYYFTASNAYEIKIDYDEFRECLLYSLNVITLRGTETSQSFSFRLCSTLEMIFGLIQSALFFMALRSKLRR